MRRLSPYSPLAMLWLCTVLLSTDVNAQTTAQAFDFEPPSFLFGPQVATTLMGATYTYAPNAVDANVRLMITTMAGSEVARQLGELSEVQCANLFLDELRALYQDFFVLNMQRPLTVAGQQFTQFRWTGDKSGDTQTGVLSCGRLAGNYYVFHFVDNLMAATNSFPSIRSSLRALRPVRR